MKPGVHAKAKQVRGFAAIVAIILPVFLFVSTLKTQRAIALGSVDSISSALLNSTVEFSFFSLLCLLVYLLTRNNDRTVLHRVSLLLLYLLTIVVVCIESMAHELFVQTGLLLNWPIFIFGLERIEMLFKAVEQQVSIASSSCFVAALAYVVVVPVLVLRKSGANKYPGRSSFGAGMASGFLLTYVLLMFYSDSFGISREEFRGASSHLVLSYFESGDEVKEPVVAEAEPLPAVPESAETGSIATRVNIAVIMLESTREKSVAPYVETTVTPYFDELAKNSLLMQHAYSTSPHTSRALYAILCGRFPRAGKGIAETLKNGIKQACLPHLLGNQGYRSAFFQSATEDFENRPQLVKNMGFDEFFPLEQFDTTDFEKSNYFGYEDNIMLPTSRAWLSRQEKPFIAAYLTVTPHFYYDAIRRYGWRDYVSDKIYNAYLNTLHYQDNFLKNLVEQYKELKLYENTLFVILGDHGEGFREHQLWGHGNIVYEEGVKVPFIMHFNKELVGKVEARTSQLDVVPSVLGQLQIQGLAGEFPGEDLRQPIGERDVFMECISPRQCSALIDADTGLKLIYNYNRKPDELFDLPVDPGELVNLAEAPEYGEIMQRLLTRLLKKISAISGATSATAYNSWAYHRKPLEWLKELPGSQSGLKNSVTTRVLKGDPQLAAVTASKDRVFAGDSFNLGLVLEATGESGCIESVYEGVKRHKRRTRHVPVGETNGSAFFRMTENLQVLPNASSIKVDVYRKSVCSPDSPVLAHHQLLIDLPLNDAGNRVFSEKASQFFSPQPLPADDSQLVSTVYLQEILDPLISVDQFSAPALAGLLEADFVNQFRNRIGGLEETYGNYESVRLTSVWLSNDGGVTSIYRYRVTFSKKKAMDFRLFVKHSRVTAFYFYHPWRQNRPL